MDGVVVVRVVFGAGVYLYIWFVYRCDVELNQVCQEEV